MKCRSLLHSCYRRGRVGPAGAGSASLPSVVLPPHRAGNSPASASRGAEPPGTQSGCPPGPIRSQTTHANWILRHHIFPETKPHILPNLMSVVWETDGHAMRHVLTKKRECPSEPQLTCRKAASLPSIPISAPSVAVATAHALESSPLPALSSLSAGAASAVGKRKNSHSSLLHFFFCSYASHRISYIYFLVNSM